MGFDNIFIIGCGYVGARLAKRWQDRGARVSALARSAASSGRLFGLDITAIPGDLEDVWALRRLDLTGHLLYYLAPPPPTGVNELWLRSLTAALPDARRPSRCVLIGTSGVYGDHQGRWVDESADTRPGSDRARRRLDGELVIRTWGRACGVPVVVLRVAGIYGPERLPLRRLRAGTPVVHEHECGYTNRIHVDDLVQVCVAAADRGRTDGVYNVSDGCPGTMTGYFNAVADAFGVLRPPAISMREARRHLTPAMLSYLSESRRLRNDKMIAELKVRLRYPDLEQGLRDIVHHRDLPAQENSGPA